MFLLFRAPLCEFDSSKADSECCLSFFKTCWFFSPQVASRPLQRDNHCKGIMYANLILPGIVCQKILIELEGVYSCVHVHVRVCMRACVCVCARMFVRVHVCMCVLCACVVYVLCVRCVCVYGYPKSVHACVW